MPEIEVLRSYEGISLATVMFRWQGMSILLERTLLHDGMRFLYVRPDSAITAEPTMERHGVKWTILSEEELKRAAGASTISSGSAPNVTE